MRGSVENGRVGTAQSLALLSLVGKWYDVESLDDRCLLESTGKMTWINAGITTGSSPARVRGSVTRDRRVSLSSFYDSK